jgi:hypothetical protein
MSTTPHAPPPSTDERQIKIVSHTGLFYWWPIWALGFILALITWVSGDRLAIVPEGTQVKEISKDRFELTLKRNPTPSLEQAAKAGPDHDPFPVRVAENKNLGVLFVIVLLLAIFNTNVPLRGLWSVIAILLVLLVSFIFALTGWWDTILEAFFQLHIYINMAGYLFISVVLFVVWFVTLTLFDPRRYMIFTPGQLRVHQDIGDAEQVYDTTGMTFEKRRSDLFRHWVLGLGSGDLLVSTSGALPQHFEMHNVLFVGSKLQRIADMMKERPVVEGTSR